MKKPKKIAEYTRYYKKSELAGKLKNVSGQLGNQLLYYILVLYYLLADKEIPVKVRMAFVAALGYFILPTDLVADFLPALGYSDDLALLTFVIGNSSLYITPEVMEKAKSARDTFLGKDPGGLEFTTEED